MNDNRLDFFIERLEHYINNASTLSITTLVNALRCAKCDLQHEDERLVAIENAAYNDATDHLKYGSGE